MFTFDAGMRVRIKGTTMGEVEIKHGVVGTVAAFYTCGDREYVGVVFDVEVLGGHDLSGAGPNFPRFKKGYCRWGYEKDFEVIGQAEWPVPEDYQRWPGESWTGESGKGPYPPGLQPVEE